jgi:catechol O-methyltransferase
MRFVPLVVSSLIAAVTIAGLLGAVSLPVPTWLLWLAAIPAAAVALNELLGKPVPFLRWSFLRMLLGMGKLLENWQVGDGREQRVADYVVARARPGDVDDAIRTIDDFGWHKSLLINVGDKKGPILDEAIRKARPKLVLELGAYIGYSALRMARCLPEGGRIVSVEFNPSNAELARRIVAHAGANDRVSIVVGTLGDGGTTLDRLAREHGFAPVALDLVFLDHAKEAYLTDLQLLLDRGWLHPGSVIVADNVKFPGAPEYRAYMQSQEGKLWRTVEHEAPIEYQSLIKDLVLVSEYLAPAAGAR